MKLKKILILVAFSVFSSAEAQTADEIIARYFANTGGLDKWKSLKSFVQSGKASQMGQEFPMTLYRKAPNKLKVVLNIQGMELVPQAYDGTTAWMLNPFGGSGPVKMDEEMARGVREEEFENDFIDYKKKGHEVTLEGTEEIDGVKCFKIKLVRNKNNPKEDVTEMHFFDSENYVPLCRSSFVKSGPQKGTEIKSYMSDYQEVDGLMFPFSMEEKVNGQTLVKMTLEKVTVNSITDDSVFAFPKK